MPKPLTLIVDDEPDICELLELTLGRMNIDTRSAKNLAEARTLLDQHKFDLCLTDMRLPDGNGISLVEYIQKHSPDTPTAVITAHGSMESAIQALKAGAFDFVSKPVDLQVLRNLINSSLKLSDHFSSRDRRSRDVLLGDSPAMRVLRGTISKVSRSQAPVYISGESGTGKELAARLIHELGPRSEKPFVPVNCGAIPEQLMESEFFGHKKGSFTGAVQDKDGLFKAADGGTLFLDEVGDLPLAMQVKLLRAIQEKSVRPVGAQTEVKVDVRVLCATHKDLADLVAHGRFRQDLYYRLNVIQLHIPGLRDRQEDIPLLAEQTCARLAGQLGMKPPRLTPEAMNTLTRYAFPGNVRELENVLERALTLCNGNEITPEDLHLPVSAAENGESDELLAGEESLDDYLERIERVAIENALPKTSQNKTAAAKLLGISFRALRYKLEKLGMD